MYQIINHLITIICRNSSQMDVLWHLSLSVDKVRTVIEWSVAQVLLWRDMTKIVFPAAYRLGKLQPSFREVPVYSHSWHKRNLARITGEGEGQNQQWVLGTLRSGQVRKRGKIDL